MDLDCRACGACCASLGVETSTIVDLRKADVTRLSSQKRRLHVVAERDTSRIKAAWKAQRTGPLAGMRACVCSALTGSVLARVSCGIYEQRPDACRDFKVGSRRCLDARREAESVVMEVCSG